MRNIFSVGIQFPSDQIVYVPYASKKSLHDADLVLFSPRLGNAWPRESMARSYMGKPSLDSDASVKLLECLGHWKRELADAIAAGKNVVIFLCEEETVYIDSGHREYSGTGRSQRTTIIVEPVASYQVLPWTLRDARNHHGSEIRTTKAVGALAPMWSEFKEMFAYQLTFVAKDAALTTKDKSRAVAAILSPAAGERAGRVVLLPTLALPESFYSAGKSGRAWNEKAQQWGSKWLSTIVALDNELKTRQGATPMPSWVEAPEYRSAKEGEIQERIAQILNERKTIDARIAALESEMKGAGALRALLYEKGAALERATRDALQILGFCASPFAEGDSEFDCLFSSGEGDFLGEVEGKDSSSINVDKLSQLERNISEDYAREGVTRHKRGVLFGNPYRLLPLEQRPEAFTAKCLSGAARAGVALVTTADLFRAAIHVSAMNKGADAFAAACRRAILEGAGRCVQFPSPELHVPATAPASSDPGSLDVSTPKSLKRPKTLQTPRRK